MQPSFRIYFPNEQKYYTDITLENSVSTLGGSWMLEPHVIQRKSLMTDANNVSIYEGDIVAGFGRDFVVKYGQIERNVLDYNERESNFVDIEGFYFEDQENGMRLFPIIENAFGAHDLDTLTIIGSDNSSKLTDQTYTKAKQREDISAFLDAAINYYPLN